MITPLDVELLAAGLTEHGFPDALKFINQELIPMADALQASNLMQVAILYSEFTAPIGTRERELADALTRMADRKR